MDGSEDGGEGPTIGTSVVPPGCDPLRTRGFLSPDTDSDALSLVTAKEDLTPVPDLDTSSSPEMWTASGRTLTQSGSDEAKMISARSQSTTASFQAKMRDLDIDLPHPDEYRPETVDFPASPYVMKKMMEEQELNGAGLDEDEETYKANLTSGLSDVRLSRNKRESGGEIKRKVLQVAEDFDISADDTTLASATFDDDDDDLHTPDEIEESIMEKISEMELTEILDDGDDGGTPTPTNQSPIPTLPREVEVAEERNWRSVVVSGIEKRIDMCVIEPYKKVLSHGGYMNSEHGDNLQAIIVFSACYLPDRSRRDYSYVMDNLFLYCLTTLDALVAEDYVLVYLHGGTAQSCIPGFSWLKRCYQMIDRRLRKNLKKLYLVHPTFLVRILIKTASLFVSSKFRRKIAFIKSLEELGHTIPLGSIVIPQRVQLYDSIKQNLEKT